MSYASVLLRKTIRDVGGLSACRIAPHPTRRGDQLLTVVTKNGDWLQATIDPTQPFDIADMTTGGKYSVEFGGIAKLRQSGRACKVSPADNAVSLA